MRSAQRNYAAMPVKTHLDNNVCVFHPSLLCSYLTEQDCHSRVSVYFNATIYIKTTSIIMFDQMRFMLKLLEANKIEQSIFGFIK